MPLPKISVITPNYNYGEFLEDTIKSIVDQNYPNLEYIIIDGGSTDNSVSIIRQYEDSLAYWQTRPKQGQYQDITEGLRRASGEILCWLNSDDMFYPWALRAVGEIFSVFPEVDWLSTMLPGRFDCAGLCIGFDNIRGFSREAFLDGCYSLGLANRQIWYPPATSLQPMVQQESTFWRRSLWEKAGGFISQDFGPAGDFDLWARFFEHADLVGVSIPLSGFRLQFRQQTRDLARYADGCDRSLGDARRRSQWDRLKLGRRVSERLRLHEIPRVRRWARNSFGYDGKRIIRENVFGPNPSWRLEKHRFV